MSRPARLSLRARLLAGLIAVTAVFLVIMLLLPRGILPTIRDLIRRRRRRAMVNAAAVAPTAERAGVTVGGAA